MTAALETLLVLFALAIWSVIGIFMINVFRQTR